MKYEVKNGVGIIPQGTKKVVAEAFKDCKELTAIEIPEGVISIGNSAFQGCTSLTDVKLPSTLEYIEDYAFLRCKSLNELVFPKSLKGISFLAFRDASIDYIEIQSEDPRLVNFYAQQCDVISTSDFFYIKNVENTKKITVPAGSLQNYIDALKAVKSNYDYITIGWTDYKIVDTEGNSVGTHKKIKEEKKIEEKKKEEKKEEKKLMYIWLGAMLFMALMLLLALLFE